MHKALLSGTVVADPEVKVLQNGGKLAKFAISCPNRQKDKQGNWTDQPVVVEVIAWNSQYKKTADICGSARGGSRIFVEGRFGNETWDDKNTGQKRTKTTITVEDDVLGGDAQSVAPQQDAEPDPF